MKIDRFSIQKFGPFQRLDLDFSKGDFGFHLIYGGNEAGKTSLMRAITAWLFGYSKMGEDWRFQYRDFLLSGELSDESSARLAFQRAKTNSGPTGLGDEPFDPNLLRRMLDDCTKEQFQSMFFFDRDLLKTGGEGVMKGQGDLGSTLFAGSGASTSAHATIGKLNDDAKAIYLKSGDKQTFSKLIKEISRLDGEEKARIKPIAEYSKAITELAELEKARADLKLETSKIEKQRHRTARLMNAIKPAPTYRRTQLELEAYHDQPLISQADSTKAENAHEQERNQRNKFTLLQEACAKHEFELEELGVTDSILEGRAEVDALFGRLGAVIQGARDAPSKRLKLEACEAEIKSRQEKAPADLFNAQHSAPLTQRFLDKLSELKNERASVQIRMDELEAHRGVLEHQKQEIEKSLASAPAKRSVAPLEDGLHGWKAAIQDFNEKSRVDEQLARLEKELGLEHARLPRWAGSLEELLIAKLPSDECITEFRVDWDRAESRVAEAEQKVESLHRRQIELQQDIKDASASVLATIEGWDEARRQRDDLWQNLLVACRGGWGDACETAAADYQRQVAAADQIAFLLHRQSEANAKIVGLQKQCEALQSECNQAEQERVERTVECDDVKSRWGSQWQGMPLTMLSPRQASDWMKRANRIRELADELEQYELKRISAEKKCIAASRDLSLAFSAMELPPPATDEAWATLLERAERAKSEHTAANNQFDELASKKGEQEKRLAELSRQSNAENKRLVDWSTKWSKLMTQLGWPADLSIEDASQWTTERLAIEEKIKEAAGHRQQLDEIHVNRQTFAVEADRLLQLYGGLSEPTDAPAEEIARLLAEQLKVADAKELRRSRCKTDLKRSQDELDTASREISSAKTSLEGFFQAAGVTNYTDFRAALNRSEKYQSLQNQFELVRQSLEQNLGGEPFDDFLADVEKADEDDLKAKLAELDRELEACQQRRLMLEKEKIERELSIQRMDQNDDAAVDARRKKEHAIAEATEELRKYAVLRTAADLLKAAVLQHRIENEGPMLERGSRFFEQLTLGKYKSLVAATEGEGPKAVDTLHIVPAVAAVSTVPSIASDRNRLPVTALSEGARDQLYLALRLAWLDVYFDRHQKMPLLMDDLLLAFDDPRASQTMQVLGEFSKRTQIIFLTHHRHLVELARRNIPDEMLFLHELSNGAAEG